MEVLLPNLELKTDLKRWHVEHFDHGEVLVKDVVMGQAVYVGNCRNTSVTIPAKCNKLVVDNCTNTVIHYEGVVSAVEVVRCTSVRLISPNAPIPTIQIDLSKEIDITISSDLLHLKMVTSNSLELTLHVPVVQPDGRIVLENFPIPASILTDQRVAQIKVTQTKTGKLDMQLVSSSVEELRSEGGYAVMESPKDMKKGGNVTVNFAIEYGTVMGELVFITGSLPELGGWDVNLSKKMEWNEGALWKIQVVLPKDAILEYKYLVFNLPKKTIRWEESGNRRIALTSSTDIRDFWALPK